MQYAITMRYHYNWTYETDCFVRFYLCTISACAIFEAHRKIVYLTTLLMFISMHTAAHEHSQLGSYLHVIWQTPTKTYSFVAFFSCRKAIVIVLYFCAAFSLSFAFGTLTLYSTRLLWQCIWLSQLKYENIFIIHFGIAKEIVCSADLQLWMRWFRRFFS